jgi:toxin YoeB
MSLRSLEFDSSAFEDLAWWIEQDRAQALRIVRLVRELQREPFSGLGKPEPLKHELSGCWSRRINQEHRLVYQVSTGKSEFFLAATITERQRRVLAASGE